MAQGPPNEPLSPSDWQFAEINWEAGHFIRRKSFRNRGLDNIVEAFGIELHLGDFEREFPAEGAEASARPESATKRRRGRRAKFDWDIVFSEFVRRIHECGIPDDDAAEAQKMWNWCLDYFKNDEEIPSLGTLRKKIGVWLKLVRR
jgi:hypothetical protein